MFSHFTLFIHHSFRRLSFSCVLNYFVVKCMFQVVCNKLILAIITLISAPTVPSTSTTNIWLKFRTCMQKATNRKSRHSFQGDNSFERGPRIPRPRTGKRTEKEPSSTSTCRHGQNPARPKPIQQTRTPAALKNKHW